MSSAWHDYQEAAASFFRRLRFSADVDCKVEGVRGVHKIDVYVTGLLHGIAFRWVVECKHWKTNIPKEKVMSLISIVQDVGADRGFLLSEVGFQSGAIRASRNTNITLSSIEDLQIEARASLTHDEVMRLQHRQREIHKRLWRLHKESDKLMSEFIKPMGEISLVDLALDDGLKGMFPVIYTVTKNDERLTAVNWDDLVEKLNDLLGTAEAYAEQHEQKEDK